MREIIEEGQNSFITTCGTCGCVFSYDLKDLVGSSVQCPYCHGFVYHQPPKPDIDQHLSICATCPHRITEFSSTGRTQRCSLTGSIVTYSSQCTMKPITPKSGR